VRYVALGKVAVTDELTHKIAGVTIDINDLWAAVIAAGLVLWFGLHVARRATSGKPTKAQLLWELIVGTVSDQVERMLGPSGRPVVPLAVTLFVFILTCNWMEIFFWTGHDPSYMPTPTSNVNIDYMMALVVFVTVNVVAIRKAGLKRYLAHFFKPYAALFPLKLIEEISKPLTLSLRLFGNVFTGALVFALLAGLFAHFLPPIFVGDVIWLPFDLAIFLIQAFIFALLTVIYYQQALEVATDEH
jgi:F-type H+-transporting ATPase subunit a